MGDSDPNLCWVDIVARDADGNSPLMIAIRDNKVEMARFILEKAIGLNKLAEVLQVVNKDDENAYSLALRANVIFINLIEEMSERDKKEALRRSKKFRFLKYKSSESFKLKSNKRMDPSRPRSEEASEPPSTSSSFRKESVPSAPEEPPHDVGSPADVTFEFVNEEEARKTPLESEGAESPSGRPRPSHLANCHSESFTFEHETIEYYREPQNGIMESLSGKFRSLMSGRRSDDSKRFSSTTTQIHFMSMPAEREVYDGSQGDPPVKTDRERLTIAHHHFEEEEEPDNSVCVPDGFHGPPARPGGGRPPKSPGAPQSGCSPVGETLMKPLRTLRSRGSSSEGRAKNYKTVQG